MKEANKQFLDEQRHHHDTLVKAFYLRSLSAEVRGRMQQILAEEFQPGYVTDLWCPPCCCDMVKLLYRYYDEWLEKQKTE